MDGWIDLARGPLFRICLAACLLGLAYHVLTSAYSIVLAWRRAGDRRVPLREAAAATASWVLPVRLLRSRPVYSAASFAFHLGVLLVPLFYVGHVALWQAALPLPWLTLGATPGDVLSILSILCLLALLVGRLATQASRALTRSGDLLVLLLLGAVLLSGLLSAHPSFAPGNPRGWLLAHMLLGDAALLVTPFTKIVHCVLFPFTQLQFALAWRLPRETGRHVELALARDREAS